MRSLTDLLSGLYHGTIGKLPQIFWHGQEIYHEQIVEHLGQLGITFSDLNTYLSRNIIGKTRKFPAIMKQERLVKKLAETLYLFHNNPNTKDIDYRTKRERIMYLVAMDIADSYRVKMRLPETLKE